MAFSMICFQLLPNCFLPPKSQATTNNRHSSFLVSFNGNGSLTRSVVKCRNGDFKVLIKAMGNANEDISRASGDDEFRKKMNLNEYMVTLEKPFGFRIAQSTDGRFFVHSLKKEGNAEKSRMIMVGDRLRKALSVSNDDLFEIKDFSDVKDLLKAKNGLFNIVLERPPSPFPIHQLSLAIVPEIFYNSGRVPCATWNQSMLRTALSEFEEKGNTGFVIFSPIFLNSNGWKFLQRNSDSDDFNMLETKDLTNINGRPSIQLVAVSTEEESSEVEYTYGNFPVEEYVEALGRSESELVYYHSSGMQYSKITDNIYVGSCMQTEADVHTLLKSAGVTAILNFQTKNETKNWGIDSRHTSDSCKSLNILLINYEVRQADSIDLRKKLPVCVGLLYRLLRQGHQVYVTCTTGFDIPLCEAYTFVTGVHTSRPDRPAIVWSTRDLIAMAEKGNHHGPPTHVVTFVWSHGCSEGEEVCLVGDFINNWKDSVRADHKVGQRYEVELRVSHGKHYYKFVVGGQWRHSAALPTETDSSGNINNFVIVGDIATTRTSGDVISYAKDPTVIKVIERLLTEEERFFLGFASRRIAFSICPINFIPKRTEV